MYTLRYKYRHVLNIVANGFAVKVSAFSVHKLTLLLSLVFCIFAFCRQSQETMKINCIQSIGAMLGPSRWGYDTSLTPSKPKLQRSQHKIAVELKLDCKLSKRSYISTCIINAPGRHIHYPCSECKISLKQEIIFLDC